MANESFTLENRAFGHTLLGLGVLSCILIWFWWQGHGDKALARKVKDFYVDKIWSVMLCVQIVQCTTSITYMQVGFVGKSPLIADVAQYISIIALSLIGTLNLMLVIDISIIKNRELGQKILKIYTPIFGIIMLIGVSTICFIVDLDSGELVAFFQFFLTKLSVPFAFISFYKKVKNKIDSMSNKEDSNNNGSGSIIDLKPLYWLTILNCISVIGYIAFLFLVLDYGWVTCFTFIVHYAPMTVMFRDGISYPLKFLTGNPGGLGYQTSTDIEV